MRHVTQDDAHIFCTQEQIQDEIADVVDYARYLYELFGLKASAELSTRPDNKLGTDEEWDMTEAALEEALKLNEIPYTIAPGEGAFYGPKIDLHMEDALGPQVADGDDPARLADAGAVRAQVRGAGQRRARRCTSSIAPSTGRSSASSASSSSTSAGAFPFWLAPVQVRVIPVGEDHREAARALAEKLGEFRVEVDDSDETVGKRIRNAEVEKIPYVVVWGDKESEGSIAVREHGGEQSTKSLAELLAELREAAKV